MGKSALSIILFILNVIYATAGIAFAYYTLSYNWELEFIKQIRTSDLYVISSGLKWPDIVTYIFIGVSVIVVLVSLWGFVGAYLKSMLIVHAVFLVVSVGVSTAATVVVYTYADSDITDDYIAEIIKNGIEEVTTSEIEAGNTTAFGLIEEKYRCCGDKTSRYYLELTANEIYPQSCCKSDKPCSGRNGNAKVAQSRHGCRKVVTHKMRNFIRYLWIGCAFVSGAGLVNFMVAAILLLRIGKSKKSEVKENIQEARTLVLNGHSVNSVSV